MTLEQALQLSPEDFWKNKDIVLAIQTVLKPGPWEHDLYELRERGKGTCRRCKRIFHRKDVFLKSVPTHSCGGMIDIPIVHAKDCAVPPPLDDPPEVLARKLKERAYTDVDGYDRTNAAIDLVAQISPKGYFKDAHGWLAWEATIEQQAICCLVALGRVETGKE